MAHGWGSGEVWRTESSQFTSHISVQQGINHLSLKHTEFET